ncbi:MAG: putative ATP-binding protein, partial [Labilithrix sp.]|nr:putative ATP-binding protein [Labilithrix sp.]
PKSERRSLAAALNTLLASPTFASWRTGATLDVDAWLTPRGGRTPAVIVSVAHLDDDGARWCSGCCSRRCSRGSARNPAARPCGASWPSTRSTGFCRPSGQPPTKHAIVALMKQARAFGVGVLLATQNPMDLDYRALSNAGLWCVGRLQTDAIGSGSSRVWPEKHAGRTRRRHGRWGTSSRSSPRVGSRCETRMRKRRRCSCSRGMRCRCFAGR